MFSKTKVILASLFLTMSFSAFSSDYEEGNEYTVLTDEPATKQNSVVEYFSSYCPHCYTFEQKVLPDLLKKLPDNIELSRSPVSFLGFIDRNSQVEMAKAYWVAHESNKGEEFIHAAFEHVHVAERRSASPVLAGVMGITEEYASKLIESYNLDDELKRQGILLKAGLRGVPSFVVNGKYLINAAKLDRQNFIEDMAKITAYLNSLED
jgi:thiol:disulfide interchange protein DsbA